MKLVREFVVNTFVGGLFVVVPVYLAILVLLKGMKSVVTPGASVCRARPGLAAG